MHTKELIERTQNYIILSNQHNLPLIKILFADDATYHSDFFGEYKGGAAIHAMMLGFFTRFPEAHREVKGIQRNGDFNSDGLIKHIAVYKPEGEG